MHQPFRPLPRTSLNWIMFEWAKPLHFFPARVCPLSKPRVYMCNTWWKHSRDLTTPEQGYAARKQRTWNTNINVWKYKCINIYLWNLRLLVALLLD